MKNIALDIKNKSFKKVYLLYGEEGYLKRQYRNKLVDAMISKGDTMNYTKFEGHGIDVTKIIDLADTMPFFAEHRVIVIEDSGFLKSSNDELADYIRVIPESTCLIFVENEINKGTKVFKNIKEVGYETELKYLKDDDLVKGVLGLLKRENKVIRSSVMELFLSKTGPEMDNVKNELDKLIAYVGDKEEIEAKDVETICSEQITNRIFDMLEAVVRKREKAALEMYYDLLSLKEPPLRILFLLTKEYNRLFSVKSLLARGTSKQEIATAIKVPGFVAGKYIDMCKNFSIDGLKRILSDCVTAEENVKTGILNDKLAVELMIVGLCEK